MFKIFYKYLWTSYPIQRTRQGHGLLLSLPLAIMLAIMFFFHLSQDIKIYRVVALYSQNRLHRRSQLHASCRRRLETRLVKIAFE